MGIITKLSKILKVEKYGKQEIKKKKIWVCLYSHMPCNIPDLFSLQPNWEGSAEY